MRIGIEAQRIYRAHKHGMDIAALELIRSLQKLDKENQYFIFVNKGTDTDCLNETSNFKIVQFSGTYPVWEQIKLPRFARKYKCDILHCTSNTAPVFSTVPLIVTIHDIIYLETNPLWAKNYSVYQKFGNVYRRAVVRKNLYNARKVITVSHFEKRLFVEVLGLPSDKVEVVYNGVGSHFYLSDEQENSGIKSLVKKYKIPQPYIIFLGNTAPKKNTLNTLKAYAHLREQGKWKHTLVVTDLKRKTAEKMLREGGGNGDTSWIHFTGYVPNTELPGLLAGADAFLYPSLRESFGIPILEAMASGTPVITSDRAAMPEIAGDAAKLIDPEDREAIAKAIDSILSNPDLQKEMKRKGKQRSKLFTWSESAKKVKCLYEKCVLNEPVKMTRID